jgi:hypothetical protein
MVRHKLEDSLIELEAAEDWHELITGAVDRFTTFAELRAFIRKNKREIATRRAERSEHAAGLPNTEGLFAALSSED